MTTLALTHGEESRERIEEGLKPHGIDCVDLEVTGGLLEPSRVPDADVGLVFPHRLVEGSYADAVGRFPWIVDAQTLLRTRNKVVTAVLLDDAGLQVPVTRMLSSPVDDETVLEAATDLEWPLVVKQNAGTKGRGAVLVHDRDSLLGVLDQFRTIQQGPVFDNTVVVQEYLANARDLRVMVIDGEYAGAVERRSDGWVKNVHRGATAPAIEPPDRVIDVAVAAASELSVDFCGVDLLVDRGSGDVVVLEVNGKPTVDDPEKYTHDFFDILAALVERAVTT